MSRSLVIVESPAKARTINRYLGKNYVVKSSVGHVRDLPVGGRGTEPAKRTKPAPVGREVSAEERVAIRQQRSRERLIRRMGVNPDAHWAATYEVLPNKKKVVGELSRLAATSDAVYLATDLDREGEAIAWHLRETIGGDPNRYRRVVFNEITRQAIHKAFENPGQLDMNRVNAQQARRFLDRVVGFELSPLLWAKVARGLSAGRVQSVAVRLIVEREREIRAFTPEEYWEAFADLTRIGGDAVLRFQVVREGGKNFRPTNEAAALAALDRLRELGRETKSADEDSAPAESAAPPSDAQPARSAPENVPPGFFVKSRDDRPTRTRPNPPFITSTLQQAASARLGYSVRRTMTAAQRLYEAGYITYMRTDSTNLSGDAVAACRTHIGERFGERYLPEKPRFYASRKSAQEAHEAIRPSNVGTLADNLTGIDAPGVRLYDLIWRRFVACQMPDAEYLSSTVLAEAGDFELRIRGRVQRFDGFTRVLSPTSQKGENRPLPDLAPGERLRLKKAEGVQHFTKPAPRYGEANLVRELEKRGIGRPSTYAAIISTVQERGYVSLVNRRFHAEKIGELVTDRLVEKFENLLDYSFTAEMEQELDRIAEGRVEWREVLNQFYGDFSDKLTKARAERGGMRANEPTDTNVECPKCGRPMQIRTASTGVFLGCSGYSLPPKERCVVTLNLVSGEETLDIEKDEEGESKLLRSKRKCPICATPMTSYLIDKKRKLHVCGNNPDCPGFALETGQFRIKGYDGPVLDCDKCGAEMQLKSGRFGKYFGCTVCSNTRKLLRDGKPAPPKADPIAMPELRCEKVDDHYLLRDGAAGLFLAASRFPKNHETRAPLVRELLPHANELDPKFRHLLQAPVEDPDGRPTVIRFMRKTREHYVRSEVDGKPTGWQAFFGDGAWRVAAKAVPKARKSASRSRASSSGSGRAASKTRKASAKRSKAKTRATTRRASAPRKGTGQTPG